METKTKIKIFLSYILLFCVFITQLQAAVFIPNVADFKSSAFNNDLPMST
jgi:hypothetical protein